MSQLWKGGAVEHALPGAVKLMCQACDKVKLCSLHARNVAIWNFVAFLPGTWQCFEWCLNQQGAGSRDGGRRCGHVRNQSQHLQRLYSSIGFELWTPNYKEKMLWVPSEVTPVCYYLNHLCAATSNRNLVLSLKGTVAPVWVWLKVVYGWKEQK
jgi:hypothetical protein